MVKYEGSDGLVACPLICGSCLIGVLITLIIYLGLYAFKNPDPPNCWYIDGLENTYLTEYEAIKAAKINNI